jgi:uncharacterized membrane protein
MRFVRLHRKPSLAAACGAAVLLSFAGGVSAQGTFTIVPQLSGGTGGNTAAFIAGYGQFVIGDSDSSHTRNGDISEGYRFDRFAVPASTGLFATGAFAPDPFEAHARGICADGAFVVGISTVAVSSGTLSGNQPRAFFWSQFGGIYNLGVAGSPAGDLGSSFAYALSGDGGTTVGATTTAASSSLQAFRWNGAFNILPTLAGDGPSIARAVSFNAYEICGESKGLPFYWTNTGGAGTTTQIAALPGAPDGNGAALGMNNTGFVIVGRITSPTFLDSSTGSAIPQATAFRWSPQGPRSLGALPSTGSQFSEALGVSNSGLVIVGNSRTSGTMSVGETEAFVWTPRSGIVRLSAKLGNVVPANVVLTTASGISFDGQTVAGTALDTQSGGTFAYVVTIPPYCVPDHNDNGAVEVQDIFDFLNDWFANLSKADANGNGVLEIQDIFDFLNAWFLGC